jgi:hypothetical protein
MTKKIVVSFLFLLFALPAMAQQGPPSVTVGWSAVSVPTPAALTYKVQRADTPAGPWVQVGGAVSGLTFTDTTVVRSPVGTTGNSYTYRLLSSCPATGNGCGTLGAPLNGDSAPSATVTAVVPSTAPLPSQPPPTPTLTITNVQ